MHSSNDCEICGMILKLPVHLSFIPQRHAVVPNLTMPFLKIPFFHSVWILWNVSFTHCSTGNELLYLHPSSLPTEQVERYLVRVLVGLPSVLINMLCGFLQSLLKIAPWNRPRQLPAIAFEFKIILLPYLTFCSWRSVNVQFNNQ
jgi:hypothetical protein